MPQLLLSLPHAARGRRSGELRNADAESSVVQTVPSTSSFLRQLKYITIHRVEVSRVRRFVVGVGK